MSDSVRDDTHSDYHATRLRATQAMQRGVWTDRFEPRFVPFAEREMRCELPREAVDRLSEAKHYMSYRGLPMAKDPLDLALYEMLFFEVQPRVVVELGAYTGASALWMADRLQTLGIEARVLAVDIDLGLVDKLARAHSAIRFLEGDCNQIDQVLPAALLDDLPHPIILIDDAHVNVDGVYRHFHQHAFAPGDYLIIEDTNPWIPGAFGREDASSEWGDWKWKELQVFFREHASRYQVDRYYTDFFGYNATWNWNGFLRRM